MQARTHSSFRKLQSIWKHANRVFVCSVNEQVCHDITGGGSYSFVRFKALVHGDTKRAFVLGKSSDSLRVLLANGW